MVERSMLWLTVVAICVLGVFLTGCSRNPNVRKQKYLESGQRYFDKGQYKEAAIQFENAIQVDGRFTEAHYKLAQTALKLQQWLGAYQELTKTVELQPDYYAAHLDIANLLMATRPPQLQEAKEHLDLLTQKQPNNPDVFAALSNYALLNNDAGGALAAMQKALQLDPKRSDLYLNLAAVQMRESQWDAAEASFKKAVELGPKSTNALVSLGNFYQVRGRFPEAEQLFERAVESAPKDPVPRKSLARLYLAEKRFSRAEEFLKRSKEDFPANSDGYRMLGDFYFTNNQLDQATTEYESLYRDHPKDLVVKENYIQLLILKNQLELARRLNDEVMKAHPDDSTAQIYKGQIEIRGGKGNDATNTLQGVLKIEPDNAVAHYQLGLAFDQLGNQSRAETEFRNAIRLQPDLVDARRALAEAAIRRGDATALAQEADQIISVQPGAADGYLLRAVAEIDRKQFAAAESFLKQALEKAPDNPAVYVQLGNLRMAENKLADAQKAYEQALNQDPNSTDALGGVLNVALVQKQPDKAISTAKAQVAKYPNNTGFHTMLGRLLIEQKKDFDGAEAEFRRAIELDRNNSDAVLKLGMVQNARGASDEALQTFLDGAKTDPKEPAFYLMAGGIYENKRDWDKAKQMYQKVLELQPDHPLASNNMAYVMLQQGGNVDVALAMAQTARRQLPDNANSADTLGWAYYQKGVYANAINLFKEAVKKEPENAIFNYHLGLAYAKNRQGALARQQLDRLLKIKPGSAEADDLRRAMAEVKG